MDELSSSNSRTSKLRAFAVRLKDLIVDPNESDVVKSVSVAVGVFISIVPLWGLQTLTAIGAAFLFKLNKPLVIAASYLSIPPILGVVLFLSMVMGGMFVADPIEVSFSSITLEMAKAALWQYLIGSLMLALLAAPLFGIATYGVLRFCFRK